MILFVLFDGFSFLSLGAWESESVYGIWFVFVSGSFLEWVGRPFDGSHCLMLVICHLLLFFFFDEHAAGCSLNKGQESLNWYIDLIVCLLLVLVAFESGGMGFHV